MPTVSEDLDGRAWYSATFSATLAASIVGMVAAGIWADRKGPRGPMVASAVVFGVGVLAAGLAPGIEVFVAARFLQGLGGGAMTVALYVLVARIYDPVDHPRIFGAVAAPGSSLDGGSDRRRDRGRDGRLAVGVPRCGRAGGRRDGDAPPGPA